MAQERIRIGVEPIATWTPPSNEGAVVRYLDIGSVDRETKTVVGVSELRVAEAPSRARQLLRAEDVLVSTVRPNLNAVAMVPPDLDGAVGSTGFTVLRANRERLVPRYLFHWVRTPKFVADMVKQATGASYPAVSDRVVLDSLIPIPNLDEQRRIADVLDKADAIRRKRKAAVALTEELLRSSFLAMFGDPVTNPHGLPLLPLGSLGELDRGRSRHRPRNDPSLLGGVYPLIQTGEVANCDGVIRTWGQTYSELGLAQSKLWPAGTLCITIAANIAKTGVLAFDACFPDSVVGYTPNAFVTIEYIQYWLSFLQPNLERQAPQVAQKNINLEILRALHVPIPPIEQQRAFSEVVTKIRRVRAKMLTATQFENTLFGSLQERMMFQNSDTRGQPC